MQLSKQLLTSAKHDLDLVTSAVSLYCHAWLHFTDLQQDTQAMIEDLSFEEDKLFNNTLDMVLQDLDKSIKTSRILGMTASLKGFFQGSGLDLGPSTHICNPHRTSPGTHDHSILRRKP